MDDELVEAVKAEIMRLIAHGDDQHRAWLDEQSGNVARAVAPLLIAHGRELEKVEIVAWLRRFPIGFDQSEVHEVADQLERGEHKQESQP